VTLQQAVLALQEIIVQGYGAQARELVSGSVSQVSSEMLEGSQFTTVSESLMGLVQGVNIRMMSGQSDRGNDQGGGSGDYMGQASTAGTDNRIAGDPRDGRPGAPAALQIRNMGEPLYLIDNVPATADDFNNLNPADIETVSLLKDASAAVYGVRAANGVLLVQTKRGGRDAAPRVQISGYYGAQNPTRYHFQYLVNAYEYQHSVVDNQANLNSIAGNYSTITAIDPAILEQWRIGGPGFESHNYYDLIMNNPNAAQYGADVSVSGGTTNSQFRLSINHTQQDYII
jgi:TonB-dependent SusC/RagA subfamily outer membrane receptor